MSLTENILKEQNEDINFYTVVDKGICEGTSDILFDKKDTQSKEVCKNSNDEIVEKLYELIHDIEMEKINIDDCKLKFSTKNKKEKRIYKFTGLNRKLFRR